jgi:hypothetical protein
MSKPGPCPCILDMLKDANWLSLFSSFHLLYFTPVTRYNTGFAFQYDISIFRSEVMSAHKIFHFNKFSFDILQLRYGIPEIIKFDIMTSKSVSCGVTWGLHVMYNHAKFDIWLFVDGLLLITPDVYRESIQNIYEVFWPHKFFSCRVLEHTLVPDNIFTEQLFKYIYLNLAFIKN